MTILAFLLAALAADPPPPSDADLLKLIADAGQLDRVTAAGTKGDAVAMDPNVAILCRTLTAADQPHPQAFYHVYANAAAAGPVWDPHGKFPVGAALVKEKLDAAAGGKSLLFTGMVKREAGFNPKGGDWEYFAAEGDRKKLSARGALASCMACHAKYAARDYVTKVYTVPAGPAAPVPGFDPKAKREPLPPVPQTSLGDLRLHSCRATPKGTKLQYEPPPHKNTLGYWVNPKDTATWQAEVHTPGEFVVEVLQGCGKNSGGAEVEVTVGGQPLRFTVQDTGHFQNFVRRDIGTVRLPKGPTTIVVAPRSKPGVAVMDLREIVLKRKP